MEFAPFVDLLGGEGAQAWEILTESRLALDRGEDVIVLSIGDPDLETPGFVVDAAVDALRKGDTHYTELDGRRSLRGSIARKMSRSAGVQIEPDWVTVLAGTQNAFYSTCRCLFGDGDEVIVLDPAYVTYEACIASTGAQQVRVEQPAATGFRPDIDAIERAVTPATRGIVFSNPSNPTGVALNGDELEAISQIAVSNDLWVVADEVYSDLVFDGVHQSIAGLPGMLERTVTVSSVSKSYAMTGWRCGWAVGPPELGSYLRKMALINLYGLPGFVMEAADIALREGAEEIETARAVYRARRDLVVKELSQASDLPLLVPEAGMFLMADVRAHNTDANDFAWDLYRATGVSVLDAGAFGPTSRGWVRISYGIDDIQLEEACRRIVGFTG
ncbi:MAG: pyridoxal phosphate-dependent aminotransferase [Actinomycetota bacterium]|nr:pyridoxal phosphate-dependent aminotransferase [Actinomycetota bacterium]MEE3256826.1 pyridoxal phosphate-dependent aminotransferase [Actinomycetota bacterium]